MMKVDTADLVTRQEAAKIYGGTPQAFDYLIRRGYIQPVFNHGHIKLYVKRDVELLKKIVPGAGRPRKVA